MTLEEALDYMKSENKIHSYEKIEGETTFYSVLINEKIRTIRIRVVPSRYHKALVAMKYLQSIHLVTSSRLTIVYGRNSFGENMLEGVKSMLSLYIDELTHGKQTEEQFLHDALDYIVHGNNRIGLREIRKTTPIQELDGYGDFFLIFNNRERIPVEIKSSEYGVQESLKEFHRPDVVVINYNRWSNDFFGNVLAHIAKEHDQKKLLDFLPFYEDEE